MSSLKKIIKFAGSEEMDRGAVTPFTGLKPIRYLPLGLREVCVVLNPKPAAWQ